MCSVDETKSFSSNADLARQVAAGRVHLQSLRKHSASHFVRRQPSRLAVEIGV